MVCLPDDQTLMIPLIQTIDSGSRKLLEGATWKFSTSMFFFHIWLFFINKKPMFFKLLGQVNHYVEPRFLNQKRKFRYALQSINMSCVVLKYYGTYSNSRFNLGMPEFPQVTLKCHHKPYNFQDQELILPTRSGKQKTSLRRV